MSKVWRRLQRVGKKAFKYRFTTYSHVLTINCNSKWQPDKICITWSRREKKFTSKFAQWEPSLKNVYEGVVYWEKSTDFIEFDATLYKSINEDKFEEKDYILSVESEDSKGKRRLLATGKLNLDNYPSIEHLLQTDIRDLKLKPATNKIKSASINFSLSCQFLKEGKATDEDMISIASYMSVSSLSTTNPYLNSNVMFNKPAANARNMHMANFDTNDSDNNLNENTNSNEEFEDEDNIEYYLKFQANQAKSNFDIIANNFGNGEQKEQEDNETKYIFEKSSFNNNKNNNNQNETKNSTISNLENKKDFSHENQTKNESLQVPNVNILYATSKKFEENSASNEIDALVSNNKNSGSSLFMYNSNSKTTTATDSSNFSNENKTSSSSLIKEKNTVDDVNNPFLIEEEEHEEEGENQTNKIQNPFLNENKNEKNPFIDDEFVAKNLEAKQLNDLGTNPFLEDSNNSNSQKNSNKRTAPIAKSITLSAISSKVEDINGNLNTSNTTRDLLDWCKDIAKMYAKSNKSESNSIFRHLKIDDFSKSTSWKNGLGFCAIIFHFKPNLIDLKELNENDPRKNLKQVFAATDSEKIMRVVDYGDILNRENLDKLSIMTFLFQLRDNFESNKKILDEPSNMTASPSMSLSPKSPFSWLSPSKILSKNEKNIFKFKNKELAKLTENKNTSTPILDLNIKKSKLTHSYLNPFDQEDDEPKSIDILKEAKKEEKSAELKKCGIIEIKTNGEIVDVSQVLEQKDLTKEANVSDQIDMLSAKSVNKFSSEKLQTSNRINEFCEGNKSEELIQKARELLEKSKKNETKEDLSVKVKSLIAENKKQSMKKQKQNRKGSDTSSSSSQSEYFVNELLNDELIGTEYVNQEILNLKNEQKEMDQQGDNIETQLRKLMKKSEKKSDEDKMLEDHLLKEWFLLVNRKNALLHKQQELEILQNEKDLEKRYEILSNKLRTLMQIEEFYKTEEQRKAESILLNELINNVMKRNELVLQLDEENKLLNEGELINEFIQNKETFQPSKEKGCSIQ